MNIAFDDTNPAAKWNGSTLAELVKGELTQNFMKGGSRELTGALRVPYVNNVPAIDKVADMLSYETYWLTDGGQAAIRRDGSITISKLNIDDSENVEYPWPAARSTGKRR